MTNNHNTMTLTLPARITSPDMAEGILTLLKAMKNHVPVGNEKNIEDCTKLLKKYWAGN